MGHLGRNIFWVLSEHSIDTVCNDGSNALSPVQYSSQGCPENTSDDGGNKNFRFCRILVDFQNFVHFRALVNFRALCIENTELF